MINKDEILEYAKLYKYKPYQIEKEYFQHLLLFLIYSNTSNLVFKGGTAIKKAYGLPRFSEDLDFTQISEIDLDALFGDVSKTLKERFGVENEVKKIGSFKERGSGYRFKIVGPLVTSEKHIEACYIYVNVSIREIPKTRDIIKIDPVYPDLPDYSIIVMSKEEIVTEKIRAILVRDKPRDVFDLWYLLKSDSKINLDWIKEKLSYYKIDFSKGRFFEELGKFRKNWEKDLGPLIRDLPPFDEVIKLIKDKFSSHGDNNTVTSG